MGSQDDHMVRWCYVQRSRSSFLSGAALRTTLRTLEVEWLVASLSVDPSQYTYTRDATVQRDYLLVYSILHFLSKKADRMHGERAGESWLGGAWRRATW